MLQHRRPHLVRGLIRDRLDELAKTFLQPQPGYEIDFSVPPGEPALIAPDSVSWRIFKNPVVLFIGGVAAVLLELAEPRVRDGVWQHTSFRTDALKRLQRTGLAAMVTVYGPRGKAEAMIAGVVRMHERISGVTSEGEPYHANDPELLAWVQATASFGFTQAYNAYARRLGTAERAALFAEGRPAALLYGAANAPTSQAELALLFERMKGRLVASPIIFEFLDIMAKVPALPEPARPLQHLLIAAAVNLLPDWLRDRLGLGEKWSISPAGYLAVRALAKAADRMMLPSSPAVQACRRLGLPDDYLYRRGGVAFGARGKLFPELGLRSRLSSRGFPAGANLSPLRIRSRFRSRHRHGA